MTLITTPFGRHSTAAEVVKGIDLSGKRAIVTNGNSYMSGVAPYALNPDNADRLWEDHYADYFQSS